jgi:hypothetical protein
MSIGYALSETSPAPRHSRRGPEGATPELYRRQGTLASPNRTARPATTGTVLTQPAALPRTQCVGESLYNDREADNGISQVRWPRPPPESSEHDQLAHPRPVSQARVQTDKEATARDRTTANTQSVAMSY